MWRKCNSTQGIICAIQWIGPYWHCIVYSRHELFKWILQREYLMNNWTIGNKFHWRYNQNKIILFETMHSNFLHKKWANFVPESVGWLLLVLHRTEYMKIVEKFTFECLEWPDEWNNLSTTWDISVFCIAGLWNEQASNSSSHIMNVESILQLCENDSWLILCVSR